MTYTHTTCTHTTTTPKLSVGAENTHKQRLTAPDKGGCVISTALAGGSREYNTHMGNICWPTVCGFFSHPVFSSPSGQGIDNTPPTYTALKRRRKQKGTTAMFSTPILPRTPKTGGVR